MFDRNLSLRRLALFLILFASITRSAFAYDGPAATTADITGEVDALLAETFKPDQPGAAAIVVRDGKVIYRKAIGLANVELGTPLRPEMVFEIGSVTKQFTSTAILMLAEEGKLALDDDIHKYLPDFPDKGARITIEHLLTHTSGIKSYTEDEKWQSMWRKDMTPAEIIALTKDQPLDFAPGTEWKYSNTGYILLGAIIEKVSGLTYADFITKRIFEPLGMKNSRYATNFGIVPNRAYGYSREGDKIVNAQFLSMTQPYAAGSLESSVDDLALWDAAVSSGKLLNKASWDRAFTPYKLANGKSTGYGYGWAIESYGSHRVIRHNGGIFGYVSEVLRIPDRNVYVAMLTNSDALGIDTGFVATRIAALAIGEPYREPAPVAVDSKVLDAAAGVYKIDDATERVVRRSGDHLTTQRTGGRLAEAYPASDNEFFYKKSLQRFRFEKDATGKIVAMVMMSGGIEERAARTDKPLPAERVSVAVDPAKLKNFEGSYELAPGFVLTVTAEGSQLFAQATGQPKFELFASAETEYFLKVVDAQVSFVLGADGRPDHLVLHQAGRDMPAKKIK